MTDRPWMPFYVADHVADTLHLSALEHGAYMFLIMHYWQAESLPVSEAELRRITRLGPPIRIKPGTPFKQSRIERNFMRQLQSVFGNDMQVAAK